MFENTNDIIVKGGCFTDETELKDILKYPLNIVYGPNGSGKTTLSRCMYSLKTETDMPGYSASIPGIEQEEFGDSVFVFNEDFIDQNVKIKENGLRAMFIFGEDNQNQAHADTLKDEIQTLEKTLDGLKTTRKNAEEEKKDLETSLVDIIKNGYAMDDKEIRGKSNRRTIDISFFDDCQNYTDGDVELAQLENDFRTKLTKYEQIRDIEKINWDRPVFPVTPSLIEEANALLNRILETDELTDRDMLIYELAQNPDTSHYIEKTQNDILNSHREFCPLCHQPISADYREKLQHRLSCVLNEKRKHFIEALDAMVERLTEIPILPPPFSNKSLCENEVEVIKDKTALLNNMLTKLRELLNDKKDMLYGVMENIDIQQFKQLYSELKGAYESIGTAVDELNEIASIRDAVKQELFDLSKKKHYLHNRTVFDLYAKRKAELSVLESKIGPLKEALNQKNNELNGLRMTKANKRIALDKINECLAYVFCSKKRLALEFNDDTYVLKSNGELVSPNKVSTGERNIIALAYFFTSIFENKDLTSNKLAPSLIVIDDPITSFDYGNRIGVFTLIKWQLQEVFKKSKGSKAIIMSHDQRTVNELFEIQKQIAFDLKRTNQQDRRLFNLRKRELVDDNLMSEYAVELKNIYDYAFADSLDNEQINVTIGNQMRRVLEHYAKNMCDSDFVTMAANTYSYHISNVSYKAQREKFDEIVRDYQLNLSRMVINTESHSDSNDYDYFEQRFAPDELQRYAQYLLCFMFDTNQGHLNAFLKKEPIKRVRTLHEKLFGV